MKVLLANPRGFCAGVDRAIDIVERALELFGPPIYVRHEVVHNRYVVDRLRGLGAVFVDELGEVPPGATVIFSAHGVSSAVVAEAVREASAQAAKAKARHDTKKASQWRRAAANLAAMCQSITDGGFVPVPHPGRSRV